MGIHGRAQEILALANRDRTAGRRWTDRNGTGLCDGAVYLLIVLIAVGANPIDGTFLGQKFEYACCIKG